MNKLCRLILWTALPLLGSACQSIEHFSIDYRVPAEVSFPSSFRRVGVVNNMSDVGSDSSQVVRSADGEQRIFFVGKGALAAEALAQTLARANHFDEVIICDSVLRMHDSIPRTQGLTAEEVTALTQELGADFLIAVENIHILTRRKVTHFPDVALYEGTVDALVSPTVRIYAPGRKVAMATLHPVDSIYWDSTSPTLAAAMERLLSDQEVQKQASDFAGEMVVQSLLPYWKSAPRSFYIGNGVAMRDAAVCAHEADWDKAVELWKQSYRSKKSKTRMQAAFNIALGYEMQDSIGTALEWARKAQNLAKQIDKVDEKRSNEMKLDIQTLPNFIKTSAYVSELEQRATLLPLLQMQTKGVSE